MAPVWKPTPTLFDMKSSPEDDESPGLPGFRTWRGVYWFVFGCFLLVVVGLTLFAHAFA
jgi:hypothetical protein